MALQLAFRPGDGEDVNSFDQLADDLGQRSDGLLRNLEKRKEEEQEKGQEATCLEEALSKLCRSDHGAAAETFLSGDENWMQGRVPNKNLYANPAVASITGLISAPRETSEADTAKSLHGVCSGIGEDMNCKVSLGMSSLDGNADVGTPRVSPLEEGDPQGSELATSSLARSQSLQTNALAPASFQPVVKELLWSTFSESYTPSDGSNVLNDFLAELDAGSSELHDRQSGACNTSSLSKWKIESGSFTDQNITNSCHFGTDASSTSQLHEEHGMHCHLKTRQSQLESDSPVFSSFHGTSEQPSGDSNVGQVENEIGLTFEGGHNVRMHFQGDHNVVYEGKQSLMSLQCSSLVDAQLGASYTDQYSVKADQNVYSSHQQISTSQSWESMYPGWYFDYSKNEWKQIEGWDISTYSMTNEHPVSGSTAVTDDYSTSNTATATLSQLNIIQGAGTMPSHLEFKERQNHIAGNNNTADVSGTLAQEQVIFTGSAWPTKEASVSTSLGSLLKGEETNLTDESEQRNIDGALQSQMQVSWEEQYPGWYFEYGVQQWCPVIAGTSVVNNGGNIEPSLSQENLLMKPEHQLNENWSVVQPVGGDGSHDRDANNLVVSNQNLSFHAWGPSVVTTHWSDPVNEKTGTVKEAFLAEGNGLSFGTQSYSSGAIQHFKEMETPFDNSYGLHSYNQSHSFYGAAKETKFTSDERPAHALVAFGFGGKLVTMKAATNSIPCLVVLHDLNQLIEASADNNRNDYFSSLNRGGLAGPLLGSGVAIKEVLKWVDDRIANCEMEDPHRTESLRILWGVLRIACMHYGKVRPTHGSSNAKSLSEEGPELDLGRLLSSSCGGFQNCNFSATSAGLQVTPPETQFQSIALEMRKRLIEGKRKEALHLAQQGQLWGPALVLASYLGEKAYAETVLQMSKQQFVPGCPLRTLFLLLGGQTGELFTALSLPSPGGTTATMKDSAGGMLSDWMGNLSIIAANPTNGDEQVITHLGDCLWKDHGEVFGAHTCYLVADATFESFSENARLCLVGADHFKWQRTFATPMSIQRTELYEYAKALGNPQFMLLPFQPFKLLYAYMLVEVGKISEARRYCQAVSKALKNVGRSSQIEFCRQTASDLEERLRMHSQGGYNLNSATGKLVGKFIGTLDNTLHRIIGGLPPRQASEPSLNRDPGDWFSKDSKAVDSTKSCQGNAPNRSVQTYLGIFSNRQMDSPSRSVSEPNLSGSREKKEDVAAASLQDSQVDCGAPKEKKNEVHRIGYLGRWISTAVSFMKPNTIKGDLGDDNKFYYNTELKRWVEEGAEQTVEEMTLPPPPVTSSFESNARNASQFFTSTESPGVMDGTISSLPQVPLLPPKGNHYSARGRLNGVQSRYVDTFNKKGTLPAKITNSPVVPTPGWVMVPSPTQFFMPVQAETSTNNATEVSEEELLDHANSSTAHTSTAQNIVAPKENEVALPNDTLSSATTVSSINKHVGVNSITGVDNSLIVPAQGVSSVSEGAQFYSQSLTRGTTWLGKAPRFFATETSINHMLSSCLPDDGNVESGVMLDSYMRTAEYPLPVPATIQLHDSAVGVENGFFNRSVEYAESLLPHDINKDSLTNMQEVEL